MHRFHLYPVPQGDITATPQISDDKIVNLYELGNLLRQYREWQGVLELEADKAIGEARSLGMPESFIAHILGAIQAAKLKLYSLKSANSAASLTPEALHAAFTNNKPALYVNALEFLQATHDMLLHPRSHPGPQAEPQRQAFTEVADAVDESYDYDEDPEARLGENYLDHLNPAASAIESLEEVLTPL